MSRQVGSLTHFFIDFPRLPTTTMSSMHAFAHGSDNDDRLLEWLLFNGWYTPEEGTVAIETTVQMDRLPVEGEGEDEDDPNQTG